jgi:hypothetical protein
MEPKFVQIAVAPPKENSGFFLIFGLDEEGKVWKGRITGTSDKLAGPWIPIQPGE